MAFVPVVSSAMSQVQYDRQTRVLHVNFGERFYEYTDVPSEVVLDVLFANSQGKEFDRLVKKGGFAYREVSADAV